MSILPKAKQIPYQHCEHGVVREDPFYWLKERENPEVLSYLEEENQYTKERLSHLEDFRSALFDEMLSKIQENDTSVPYKMGDYWYYSRTEEKKAYAMYCRKFCTIDAPEEVILDVNELAKEHSYFDLGGLAVSPDQQTLLYSVDTKGRELYTIYLLDLQKKSLSSVCIEETTGSIGWSEDNNIFLFSRADSALRPYQVWAKTVDGEESLLYQEDDEKFRVGFYKSTSKEYIFLYSVSSLTNEYHFLSSKDPLDSLTIFSSRHLGLRYWVSHAGDRFLIRNNDCDDERGVHTDGALNCQVHECSLEHTQREHWSMFIPHRDDVQITSLEAFSSFLVLCERKQGQERYRIIDTIHQTDEYIDMPESVYMLGGGSNPNFDTRVYRFGYGSLVSPSSTFDFDLDSKEMELQKQTPVRGYEKEQYTCFRIMIPGHDGELIPASVVHRKDIDRSIPQPLYLYAYGSYGSTMDPYFSSSRLSFLDRGVIYVIAHPRGGSMLGRKWYEDGKFLKKKNTFFDFISVAEFLIENDYTSSDKLIISGGSAGGLLIGAVINMKPELFHAAIADVPFVDVVTTMLDETIPLTTGEWEEWGNPKEENYFHYMLSYSPYDNVQPQEYPNLLVTAGLHDPRVQYWEPAKWVAQLREIKTGTQDLYLKTEMSAGHMGQTGRYGYLEDMAYNYAFAIDQWGMITGKD